MGRPTTRPPDDCGMTAEVLSITVDLRAAQIVPLLDDLYGRLPETRRRTLFELSCYLWSLGYVDELLDEGEIAEAERIVRTDWTGRAA